jgi:DNA-binding transcriptional LysR family regulator
VNTPAADPLYSFRRLQVAAAVARAGGVRRASAQLNLSQPAISQAIAKLEAALGEPLFERTSGGMFPTPGGGLFLNRIERLTGYLKAGEREFAGTRGAEGPPLHRLVAWVEWRALLALIEHGSYAATARALGVSPPSVHRAVGDLQRRCGRPLFRVTPSGTEPTAEALALARWVRLALREIEQGLDELRERRGLDGAVVIGSLALAETSIVPTAVTRLLAERPDARVRIIDGAYAELLQGLRHGEIDLILGALRLAPAGPGFREEALFSEPLSIVVRAGHPILANPPKDVAALSALEWIAPTQRKLFTALFREHGAEPPARVIECSSFVAIRGLLLQSDRAAFLSASQAPSDSPGSGLAVVPIPLSSTARSIGICTRDDWAPTATQARLVALVREASAR